jgi:hypothetical protein
MNRYDYSPGSRYYAHTFHIPVMGIGFTLDTPAKVAQYGISSVISLVDDMLMEKMREFYSIKLNLPFQGITEKIEDFRAKRITAFLNLMDKMVKDKFEELKHTLHKKSDELDKYMDMLPDSAMIKQKFRHLLQHNNLRDAINWLHENMNMGSIDVNIMTKLDKENFSRSEKLPVEYNDAHAALRGFANSELHSSIVLSAGMNPRLYNYLGNFPDFFPDHAGELHKKIVLKVSDYRSALIQGKYLAKKGLWVSEYRVESGLNCGGHAFATQGFLLGPILEEFKVNRDELIRLMYELYAPALREMNKPCPDAAPLLKITAQGGVGTAEEHQFLLAQYDLDSVGWGTPFLLVPEATNVDEQTLTLLAEAREDDLYLSNISPLGVPFNSLRGNTKDLEKQLYIDRGRPGSPCTKKYASLNMEYTDQAICTASRQYQTMKLKALDDKQLGEEEYAYERRTIIEKSCLCVGLGTSALIVNELDTRSEGKGVSVCPGPNMAYFSKIVSLKEMVSHIYGKQNIINRTDRPNMFVKELSMYLDFLKQKISESAKPIADKQKEYLLGFKKNLHDGIEYYINLFTQIKKDEHGFSPTLLAEFRLLKRELDLVEQDMP